jgi:hypothetical protein
MKYEIEKYSKSIKIHDSFKSICAIVSEEIQQVHMKLKDITLKIAEN